MGQADFYPFVLTPAVIDKLRFVHEVVHGATETHERPAGRRDKAEGS